jgi:hypothetical protein
MTFLSALRDRIAAGRTPTGSDSEGSLGGAPDEEGAAQSKAHGRLPERQLIKEMRGHSQKELEDIEAHERSHKKRPAVLSKLGYMRGRQPVPGYDDLDVGEIAEILGEADLATIKRVRSYERKFANRPDVLEEVARVHARRRSSESAKDAAGYQPQSARATGGRG